MRLMTIFLVALISVLPRIVWADDAKKFVGTWTLEAIDSRNELGNWEPADDRIGGTDPIGYIMYDAYGNMAVQIMRRDRPKFETDDVQKVAAETVKTAFLGYSAYFGTYSVDDVEKSVTHHRIGHRVPDDVGTDVRRHYIFDGDTLSLMPNTDIRLRWKRKDKATLSKEGNN